MHFSVIDKLRDDHGIIGQLGKKTECPFCGHAKTFSIKEDDTIGKCFHPDCGRFITMWSSGDSGFSDCLYQILGRIYGHFHTELMIQAKLNGLNAYDYLVEHRKIHPQVVADSMLGTVPADYTISQLFMDAKTRLEGKELVQLEEAEDKLRRCIDGARGWLCFFYTDACHRIVSIRFRKPYNKRIMYYKPFDNGGLFGHGLFSSKGQDPGSSFKDITVVTEGEFNQLQLQSLVVRHGEQIGEDFDYIHACAVGGVSNADYESIENLTQKPVVCYDNDASRAGWQLVEKSQELFSVEAFTTPEVDSDLDDFVKSYGHDYSGAWEAIEQLVNERRMLPRHYDAVKNEVFDIRKKRGKGDSRRKHEINVEVTNCIIGDLKDRCEFYHDGMNAYLFFNAEKQLTPIDGGDSGYMMTLHRYGINSSERIYAYLVRELYSEAMEYGTETTIHRLAFFDQDTLVHYLTNHNNHIIRTTAERIDVVDNGTDGVLFLSDPETEPFELVEVHQDRSLLRDIILSKINFSEDRLTRNDRSILFIIWLVSLLFENIMPHKVILAFIGDKGSGKSNTLEKIGKLLFGKSFQVTPLPNKSEDFDVIVSNAPFVAIDNADSRVHWLEDKMATLATGGSIRKRILYTTNQVASYPIKCNLSITARTPHFKREDVAERLIIMKVDSFKQGQFLPAGELLKEVLDNRNVLMTELVNFIQDVVLAYRDYSHLVKPAGIRMADFDKFAMTVATAAGIEDTMRGIFKRIGTEQSAFTLDDDPVYELLFSWVEMNQGEEITNADLCRALSRLAEECGVDFYYKGKERSFSQMMSRLLPNIEEFLDVGVRNVGGRKKMYSYSIKNQAGER